MMMRISHLGGAKLNFRKGPIIVAETIKHPQAKLAWKTAIISLLLGIVWTFFALYVTLSPLLAKATRNMPNTLI